MVWSFGTGTADAELLAVRAVFGEWHTLVVDGRGALVAATCLGVRRSCKALLNTPAMFHDAVRLAAEARLREIAYTDQLTGTPNRAAYQQRADALPRTTLRRRCCSSTSTGSTASTTSSVTTPATAC